MVSDLKVKSQSSLYPTILKLVNKEFFKYIICSSTIYSSRHYTNNNCRKKPGPAVPNAVTLLKSLWNLSSQVMHWITANNFEGRITKVINLLNAANVRYTFKRGWVHIVIEKSFKPLGFRCSHRREKCSKFRITNAKLMVTCFAVHYSY